MLNVGTLKTCEMYIFHFLHVCPSEITHGGPCWSHSQCLPPFETLNLRWVGGPHLGKSLILGLFNVLGNISIAHRTVLIGHLEAPATSGQAIGPMNTWILNLLLSISGICNIHHTHQLHSVFNKHHKDMDVTKTKSGHNLQSVLTSGMRSKWQRHEYENRTS